MKKTLLLLLIVVVMVQFLSSCGYTDNWNYVDIDGYGRLQLPEEWAITVEDGFMCVFSEKDGDRSNVLVQYRSNENVNQRFDDIENMTWLQDVHFSNGASITKYHIDYQNGLSEELFSLCFTGSEVDKSTVFLCVDSSVSEEILRKIAKSYISFEKGDKENE